MNGREGTLVTTDEGLDYPAAVRPLASLTHVLVPALAVLGSCNKVEFRTAQVGSAVPLALKGEWQGNWQSSLGTAGGELSLQVQEFESDPLISVLISHPCLPTSTYEISFSGTSLELRHAGEIVFAGELVGDRTLVGTFQCDEDSGTWSADWQRALPPVVDLTGLWQGQIESLSGGTPLRLEFDQRVVQGSLEVTGLLSLPLELATPLPVRGLVRSRDGFFELSVTTVAGIVPQVVIGGIGDSSSLSVDAGLVSTSGQPLSFTQGVANFALLPQTGR